MASSHLRTLVVLTVVYLVTLQSVATACHINVADLQAVLKTIYATSDLVVSDRFLTPEAHMVAHQHNVYNLAYSAFPSPYFDIAVNYVQEGCSGKGCEHACTFLSLGDTVTVDRSPDKELVIKKHNCTDILHCAQTRGIVLTTSGKLVNVLHWSNSRHPIHIDCYWAALLRTGYNERLYANVLKKLYDANHTRSNAHNYYTNIDLINTEAKILNMMRILAYKDKPMTEADLCNAFLPAIVTIKKLNAVMPDNMRLMSCPVECFKLVRPEHSLITMSRESRTRQSGVSFAIHDYHRDGHFKMCLWKQANYQPGCPNEFKALKGDSLALIVLSFDNIKRMLQVCQVLEKIAMEKLEVPWDSFTMKSNNEISDRLHRICTQ